MCVKNTRVSFWEQVFAPFFSRNSKLWKEKMFSRIRPYIIAVAATGIAWLVDLLLQERFSESSGGLYVAAALVSTWIGGLAPGLFVVVLTVGINLAFSNHPYLSMAVGVHGFERLILFSAVAITISVLTARVRANQQLLRDLNAELEDKVEKRTDALNESNQQLQAFCYTLAHDLRAPLRAIQGFADIMMMDHEKELSAEARAHVERIRNSAERMGRLILDLLAYTDLTRADFQKQAVDVEVICENVLRMFIDEIRRTNAEVCLDLPAKKVVGDRVGIERVLVNLVTNALKFAAADRAPRIEIISESRRPNVRISVRDNGIGLDVKYREQIFGVFQRLPTSNDSGTGMGLAIVKRSVEKMGGSVGVNCFPGSGCTFWFELPEAVQKKPAPELQLAGHERV